MTDWNRTKANIAGPLAKLVDALARGAERLAGHVGIAPQPVPVPVRVSKKRGRAGH